MYPAVAVGSALEDGSLNCVVTPKLFAVHRDAEDVSVALWSFCP
jgi:hypothetical protein